MIAECNLSPDRALYVTPKEVQAAQEGWSYYQRVRVVLHPNTDFGEREARRYLEGRPTSVSPEEQQQRLDALKDKLGS